MRPLVLSLFLFGCSAAVPEQTDTTPPPAPPPVATTEEAPARVRAPITVMTGEFENPSAACNEWSTDDADAIRSVPARTGDYSCKVCALGRGITLGRRANDLEPGRYRLRAWVRGRAGLTTPAQASIELDGTDGVGSVSAPVTGDWTEVSLTFETTGSSLLAKLGASDALASQCLLIDDVVLEKL